MKWISEKISYYRHETHTTLLISTKIEPWQKMLIFAWLCVWLYIGGGMLYILIGNNFPDKMLEITSVERLKLYLSIFLIFWGYFFYKIGRVFYWRTKGVEFIKLDFDKITYKKAFGKFGTAHQYLYDNIEPIKIVDRPEKSFASVMQSSFWDIGNQTVSFKHFNQDIIFGMQLEKDESRKLMEFVNKEIKNLRKNNSFE